MTGTACQELTVDLASQALGGQAVLDPGDGTVLAGADICTYRLQDGASSTYANFFIFAPDSEYSGGMDAVRNNCVGDEELTPVDDVAPGALRCTLTSSYDGSILQDSVSWEDGSLYSLELNASGDDAIPVDVVVDVAEQIIG